jgi:hypothetical protein
MAARTGPGYGTPNWEMLGRWLELPAEQDGPFWALNLMRYKEVADYGADGPTGVSGRAADDAYAPLGPLAAVGAMVALHADVARQPLGDPTWDRVGIVRYPSRSAFLAMQQRDDFKQQHVHKEAGMGATIVLACHPDAEVVDHATGPLVLTVERGGDDEAPPALPGVTTVAELAVEGVIVGDQRTWTRAFFDRVANDAALAAVLAAAAETEEAFVLVLEPGIDRLVESIRSAPTIEGRGGEG